ncbi:MAG TPA: myo-inosose-2 dehydratase [Leptolyngbyaceae cyanobacterium]
MLLTDKRKLNKSRINGFLGILFAFILVGVTCITLPANAAPKGNESYLISLVSPSNKQPIFNPEKVHLGITPTGWSNSDDRSIDTCPPTPYRQIISEIALSGFVGTQMSPAFPEYPKELELLKSELGLRNVKISEPWVGTRFTEGKKAETIEEFKKQVQFMKDMGGKTIVVAEMSNAVHLTDVDPLVKRPHFSEDEWEQLTEGLNEIGAMAKSEGMQLMYHPHIGTGVENLADIDRLMEKTKPEYVNLLLDTGHLYYAGVNPLDVTKKYINRIKHVHLKNIRSAVLEKSKSTGRSFLDSIRAGIFTVPGDENGAICFDPILTTLAEANYEGWLMVEAEQDPNKANPLQNALMARNYLRKVTGL